MQKVLKVLVVDNQNTKIENLVKTVKKELEKENDVLVGMCPPGDFSLCISIKVKALKECFSYEYNVGKLKLMVMPPVDIAISLVC